jgi:hypothetical protein
VLSAPVAGQGKIIIFGSVAGARDGLETKIKTVDYMYKNGPHRQGKKEGAGGAAGVI